MRGLKKERCCAWDGSGVNPSWAFANPEPEDTSVIGTVIKGAVWEEVLDPQGYGSY